MTIVDVVRIAYLQEAALSRILGAATHRDLACEYSNPSCPGWC